MIAYVQPGQRNRGRQMGDCRGRSGVMSEESTDAGGLSRRCNLRLGAAGGSVPRWICRAGLGGPLLARRGLLSANGAFAAASTALVDHLIYIEAFPTSPLILTPFSDALPVPKALAPGTVFSVQRLAEAARSRTGSAELAGQPAASDLAEPDRLSGPDRLQDRRGWLPTLSPRRRCCRSTRRASRRSRSTRPARPSPRARRGRCR